MFVSFFLFLCSLFLCLVSPFPLFICFFLCVFLFSFSWVFLSLPYMSVFRSFFVSSTPSFVSFFSFFLKLAVWSFSFFLKFYFCLRFSCCLTFFLLFLFLRSVSLFLAQFISWLFFLSRCFISFFLSLSLLFRLPFFLFLLVYVYKGGGPTWGPKGPALPLSALLAGIMARKWGMGSFNFTEK